MKPTPLTLPAPIPAKVKPASSPAERMKRIEDRYLFNVTQLFSKHSRKELDAGQLIRNNDIYLGG